MKILILTNLTDDQKMAALAIWNVEYPVQLQMPTLTLFDEFLDSLISPNHYLLLDDADKINGWAAVFTAETVRCFFIMVAGDAQGKGYGTLLLNELKKHEKQLFGFVIDHENDVKADGRPYPSPLDFYRKNGFTINEGLRLETELLSAVNIVWEREANEN